MFIVSGYFYWGEVDDTDELMFMVALCGHVCQLQHLWRHASRRMADPMPVWAAQPWDCASRTHSVYVLDRCTPCPWMAKIDGEFYPQVLFTVDYTDSEIADDPAQQTSARA